MNLFSRQITLFGEEIQNKIKRTKVAIIGLGGIGSWLAISLAKLGVEYMLIADRSTVDLPDLHRQIYDLSDIGIYKVDALEKKLKKINEAILIEKYKEVNEKNILEVFSKVDIVFDATDNIKTREIINEASIIAKKPWIFASVSRYNGFVAFIDPSLYCFYDIFKGKQDGLTSIHGIYIGTVLFVVSLQLQLFINYLQNRVENTLYYFNLQNLKIEKFKIRPLPRCPIHHERKFKYLKWS